MVKISFLFSTLLLKHLNIDYMLINTCIVYILIGLNISSISTVHLHGRNIFSKGYVISPLFSVQHPVKLQREVKGAGDCNCAEEILQQVGLVDAEHQAVLLHQVQVHLEHLSGSKSMKIKGSPGTS